MKPHIQDAIAHLLAFTVALTNAAHVCNSVEQQQELQTIIRLAELQRKKLAALINGTPPAA